MYYIEFRYWKSGNGYTHNETMETLEIPANAQDYWNGFISENDIDMDADGINVEVWETRSEFDVLVSEYFVEF